jgi:hypothetical protein
MMVMMMAITPSLNAASLSLPKRASPSQKTQYAPAVPADDSR